VSGSTAIDPCRFVQSVTPLLESKDLEGLLCHLKQNYTPDQITSLLSCPDCDARKVAALALSLVGRSCCIPAVAERLKDPDAMTNQMAEHALWSIWFRCGSPAANDELARGTQCLSDRKFDCAFKHFGRAIELSPDFAEAYNQRAIANYLQEKFADSLIDCHQAVRLMPCHFGAWAGLGHCYAHLNQPREAIKAYEKALGLNPHLDCIKQAVSELRKQLL
jgi:tetratricopeptide (TPR) repeat protein